MFTVKSKLISIALLTLSGMSQAQALSCPNVIVETPEKSVELVWQGMENSVWPPSLCGKKVGRVHRVNFDLSLRKNAEQICDELDLYSKPGQYAKCYAAAEIMAAGAKGANDLGINDGYKKGQEWANKHGRLG